MAAMRTFYFLVWDLCFLVPVAHLQATGYFGWTSTDGGQCWSKAGVSCSLQPSGCGPNQVNNPWGVGCNPGVSITLNRPTGQTSTASGQPSNLGVDGDVSTCASTTTMDNPAWFVDLPGLHVVHGVRFKGGVYVNSACSNTQIAIKVEGKAEGAATNNTKCTTFGVTAHCNFMQTINCDSVGNPGNRLVIHHTGTGQLEVCELEIIGYQYPYNLAYGKPVMQDGTHASRYAYYAVDGQLGTSQTKPDCTQNGLAKPKPWWMVDLGSQNVVYSVTLLNIEDSAYYRRLRDFTIYVGDKNTVAEFSSNAVCHTHGSTPVGAAASEEFQCQNGRLLGRYVIVQLDFGGGDAYLQLCEVMVKGYQDKGCQDNAPDCSRPCPCRDLTAHVYTCDYINGKCCGPYKKGTLCEQDLPKLTNAPEKESSTDTSIKVKWNPVSATGVKYELTGVNGMVIDTIQTTERNVTGLQRNTQYCFRVIVRDENDWRGEPSPDGCIKTCGDPTGANLDVSTNLEGSKTKSNIVITWNHLGHNCDSGHVELRVQQGIISCDQISGIPLNTGSASSFTVSNKIPYTNYTVKFTLINNIGLKRDMCKTIQTAEGVPPSPANATASSSSSTSISVTWSKPNPPHGMITKYEIQYSNTNGNETANNRTVNQTIGDDEIMTELPDLIPNTNYSVKVRAFTSVGSGSWSETLYVITAVGKPEKPEELRNTSQGQTYIVLEWKPPPITNGQITGYEVTCSPDGIVKPVLGKEDLILSVNITNLKPSTEYSCKVTASTSAGFGKFSEAIQVWTNPKIELPTDPLPENPILSKTETSITIKLVVLPKLDVYRIIIEKRKQILRKRRATTGNSVLSKTNLGELTGYSEAEKKGLKFYIAAEMSNPPGAFTVGDGKVYGGYTNQELVPGEKYNVYYGGKKTTDGVSDEGYLLIVEEEVAEKEVQPIDNGNMAGIIGGAVGGVATILVIVIIVIVVLRRKGRGPFAKTTTKSNQELVLSDISQNNPHAEGNSPEARSDKGGKEHVYTNADESLYGNIDSGTSDVHVDNIWEAMRKKTKEVLKLEYEELPKEFVANCDAGRLKENFHKNRYKNILPYDQTRVVLKTEKDYTSDYINADFMDAYNKSDAFIAAQGPKDLTLIDFWRMLWQCNCPIIVMLTKLVEDGKSKCNRYWPSNGTETYGNIIVTLVETEEFASFTVRTLSVSKNDERGKKTIKQFHFTAWPDHGVPKYATALLEFQRKVRHYQDSLADDGHVVVHCSAGIGRTGAYIALDFLLAQARSEGKFNVFNQIYSMRTQRAKMIQTLEQYYFVHDALLEALLCGDVIYPCSNFQETYPQLKKKQRKSNKSKIEEQFDVLRLICPVLDKDSYRTAIEPENNSKNRIKNILPANNSRPYLMTPVKGRTDYINAVFIDGFKKKDAYIITQMPLADTVVDFWRMMYDHGSHTIVMLNDLDDEQSCAVYWPSKGTQQHGPLTVEVKKAKKKDESIMILQLQLTNTEKPDSKPQDIWQFQFKGWQSSKKVPNSTEVFLRLLDEVANWQKQCNDSTITIHCMNGAQRSGLFCAVSVMLEKMKTEQDVDVFQSVKSIRVNRPQLIEDATQLEFCYDVANEYLKGFDTYANFASL